MASGAKGTIGNPYSMSEYQDLLENDSWQGIGLYSILINPNRSLEYKPIIF